MEVVKMLQIALFDNEPESADDVLNLIKRIGYKIIKIDEHDGYLVYFVKKNKIGAPSKKIPRDEINELIKNGMSISDIAKKYNVSRASIYKYLKM